MGRGYNQLSLDERITLAELHRAGRSIRQIASALHRQPSTIARELKRNAGTPSTGYRPDFAQQKTAARRWTGSMLDRNRDLREQVLGRLSQGWSPVQVAGRLERETGRAVISHETIYRFIYAQLIRTNKVAWRLYLPRGKTRRGLRPGRGGSPALHIKQRISIDQRPLSVGDRQEPGHWEADFMLFSKQGQSVMVLHERTSRMTALVRPQNRLAEPTAQRLAQMLEPLPSPLRRSLTFDNGTEFAYHYRLRTSLGMDTYFCDPHAPWQKGGVENAIGRLRRWLPRKTDLENLSSDDITKTAQIYNHTPRKCLDFQTPAEVFSKLLHFKCESTPRPPPG